MRFLSLVLVVLALCLTQLAKAEDIRVKKDEAIHFMRVIEDLQHLLSAAAGKLTTPEGVRQFRDLAEALRLHQRTLAGLRGQNQESFALLMVQADPWVNRNIGFADSENGGGSAFKKMFDMLDTHSDVAISASRQFQAPLINAAVRIENTSGLELASGGADPRGVVITGQDLEAAVAFAAIGLATFPGKIAAGNENAYYALPKVDSLIYLHTFLNNPEALAVLQKRARTSIHAAIALRVVSSRDFSKAMNQIPTTLIRQGEGYGSYYLVSDEQKFKTYVGFLMGAAGLAKEEAEGSIPPSQVMMPRSPVQKGKDKFEEKHGGLDGDDAEAMGIVINALLQNLGNVNEVAKDAPATIQEKAMALSVLSLTPLLEYLAKNPDNHLLKQLMSASPFSTRNLLSLGRVESGTSVMKRLKDAVFAERGTADVLQTIEGIFAQESLSQPGRRLELDVQHLDSLEVHYTVSFAVGVAVAALQALPAGLIQSVKRLDNPALAAYTVQQVRAALIFVARRQVILKGFLADLEATKPKALLTQQVRSAVAVAADVGNVLEALHFLENGFLANDGAAGLTKLFSNQVGAQQLNDLMTSLQYPAGLVLNGGDKDCVTGITNLGLTRKNPN